MYEQLLCHLVGDYFLQTDYQALNKKKNILLAFKHGFIYTIPFISICHNILALLIIAISHSILDYLNYLPI